MHPFIYSGDSNSCASHAKDGERHLTGLLASWNAKLEISDARKKLEALMEEIDKMEKRLAEIKKTKDRIKSFLLENGFKREELK